MKYFIVTKNGPYFLGSFITTLLLQVSFVASLNAETLQPVFHLPLNCTPGDTCFVQNYVDTDPSSNYRDYMCGLRSYDDHKGTDFRLANIKMMYEGTEVVAAAPGIVRAIRDGMQDVNIRNIDPSSIKGREAGNSVVIRHKNGWESQYSHLLKGSVSVKAGDRVETGQVLGLVGMSGNTEFPHLHFSVRYRGRTIDPFTGEVVGSGCGISTENSLWDEITRKQLVYLSSGVLSGGFTDAYPDVRPYYENITNKTSLSANQKLIIFWIHIFGVQSGDKEELRIIDPDGNVIAEKIQTSRFNLAQEFKVLGKETDNTNWMPGIYQGNFKLYRTQDDQTTEIISKSFNVEILKAE